MPGVFTKTHSFRRGCVGNNGRLLLLLVEDALALDRVPHTGVLLWDNGRFRPITTSAWTACAAIYVNWPDAEFVVVGEQGQLLKVRSDCSVVEELVFHQPPTDPGMFKGAVCLESELVIVGTGFWCATVAANGQRKDISPRQQGTVTDGFGLGFEAVDGFNASSIVAVGWDGAIWTFDGSQWSIECSPVNLILSDVLCLESGEIWACGQEGTIVSGRPGQWRALETGLTDNLWSLVSYQGGIVVASSRELFRFVGGEQEPQRIGLDSEPSSFYWLDARDGRVMLSTGAKNVVLVLPDREIVID